MRVAFMFGRDAAYPAEISVCGHDDTSTDI